MKTFKDLQFKPHEAVRQLADYGYANCTHAVETFDNGYGVSVLLGEIFYSNGKDTYEVAILANGEITFETEITDGVLGYLSEQEVSDVMVKVQSL